MRPLKLTTCKTTVKRTNLHLRELFTFNILSRLLTRSVCGVHGGERDADAGGAEEGDGELREVGDDHAEDVALLGPHPQEAAAKLLDHRVRHLVRVLAPVETAYLNTWVWKFSSYVTDALALMRVWEGSKHCNRLFSLFEFPFSNT